MPTKRNGLAGVVGFAVTAAIVIGGCGGDSSDDADQPGTTAPAAQTPTQPPASPASKPRATVDDIKAKFPQLIAGLAAQKLVPKRPEAYVDPGPVELQQENTANGWQFTVGQYVAPQGTNPDKPNEAPPGTTAFDQIIVDGFAASSGADAMRTAYVAARTSKGYTVANAGDGTTPTRLHRESNGLVSTTVLFVSGNTLVRLVNVCRMCSPDNVNRDVNPVVTVLQREFPPGP